MWNANWTNPIKIPRLFKNQAYTTKGNFLLCDIFFLFLKLNGCFWFTSIEVYNFIFITEQNNKSQFYTELIFEEFSFTEKKDELQKFLGFSEFSPEYLKDNVIGTRNSKAYIKLSSGKRRTDGYYMLIIIYAWSSVPDFEIYPRSVVDLEEE